MTGPEPPALLDPDELGTVAALLRDGAVVGVPTDTVYGLAVLLEDEPVRRLFEAKGRPLGLALPVLVGARAQVGQVASSFPPLAAALADRFWPGPLTLVVPARRRVGRLVGGDGRTVGIRWPAAPLVEELCLLVGPLAVTSANRHGEPAARCAAQVVATFPRDQVAAVLDGGTGAGTPSSVVDCARRRPRSLREGALPWSEIEAVLAAHEAATTDG